VSGLTGFPDQPPVGLGTLHSDFTTPYFGALQIMAALHHRELTGEGQYLELAQYEAALHLHDTELLEYLVNGDEPPRLGNRSREFVPHGVFRCRGDDRWVAIAVRNDTEWLRLCDAMDRADLAARPDLRDQTGRRAAEDKIEAAIQSWTATDDAWTIAQRLQACGVSASPVEDVGDLVEHDPGMRDHFVTFAHPEGVDILVQQEPLIWNGERLPLALAPLMGEHNDDVFQNLLGHSQDQVVELMVEQVIY
jgi:benzylsuccinate CoA-transferase BbsF subunit